MIAKLELWPLSTQAYLRQGILGLTREAGKVLHQSASYGDAGMPPQ